MPGQQTKSPADLVQDTYIKEVEYTDVKMEERNEPSFWLDVCPYFQPLVIMLAVIGVYLMTGNMLLGAWIMYIGTPLYNLFYLDDDKNLKKENEKAFMKSQMFYIPLYAYIFTMLGVNIYGLFVFSSKWQPEWAILEHKPDSVMRSIVFTAVLTFFHALSSLAGHELVHNKETMHKIVGTIPYTQMMYSHFWDEHTRGHHKYIGTPEDPVSHAMGTSIYRALYDSFTGTHKQCWDRENRRLEKEHGKGNVSAMTVLTENQMVYYFTMHMGIIVSVYHLFGTGGLKFQAAYTFLGVFWQEAGNYLEHYGLMRTKDESGIFQTIGYLHSWNSTSTQVTFRIQRHSDHHAHKFRPYQILRRFDRAPQLPFEYILMLQLALVPPMFYYIVDPRIKSIQDAEKGIKNPDQWNAMQNMSEDDKHREKMAKIYFVFMSSVFTYVTLFCV